MKKTIKMNKKIINIHFAVLFLLILFHVSNNIYFLNNDNIPLVWDTYNYYQLSVANFKSFSQGDISGFLRNYITFHTANFVFFPSFLLYSFSISQDIAAFQGTIFLIILIIATYLLGKELFNKDVGLLAAVFISFSPHILAISKVPYEDIAFAAMFTLTLYFFLKSKKFSDIKYTWFFNISLGSALLSRYNSLVIMSFLILSFFILKLVFDRKDFLNYFSKWERKNIIHFLISLFVSMTLPFIFFFNNITASFKLVFQTFNMNSVDLFNIKNLFFGFFYYIKTLNLNFEYLFIFVVFIVSFALFLLFSKKNRLLILSLIIGANLYHLTMFYLFPIPFDRIPLYLVFMKPVYIIILSLFFLNYSFVFFKKIFDKYNLKIRKKKYFISLIIIFIIVFIPFTLIFNYTNKLIEPSALPASFGKYHPSKTNYDIEDLVNQMIPNYETYSIFIFCPFGDFVLSFKSYIFFNYDNVKIIDLLYGFHYFSNRINTPSDNYNPLITNGSFESNKLKGFDYIILCIPSTKDASSLTEKEFIELYPHIDRIIQTYILKNEETFNLLKKIEIDDSNNILIYKNLLTK